MTISPRPARLLLGSMFTVLALGIAGSCAPTQPSIGNTGAGGDVAPVPPSPLCGGQGSASGGVTTGPVPPGIPGFSPFPPQLGQTITVASVCVRVSRIRGRAQIRPW